MNVSILAFGIVRDIFGSSSVNMEVRDACQVAELRNSLEEKFPQLKQLSSFMIAVNNRYAALDEKISTKDEIAIIPPVSGG